MAEPTEIELAVLGQLAAGPKMPSELGSGDAAVVASRLARLETLGLARIAGSSDNGPWMLTIEGQALLWGRMTPPTPCR